MKFENLYAKDRHLLHEVIPLDTPYSVNIEPSSYCNIRCVYCIHSLTTDELISHGFDGNYSGGNMTKDTFDLLVEQLSEFPKRIKSITFGGVGEPLMNKRLPEMIAHLKARNITDRINLITNGLLLSEPTSLALIEAGLDSMKISLQGINAQSYLDTCGYEVDFHSFVQNIGYLYQNRKQCVIGIKVPDISLYRGKKKTEYSLEEKRYKDLFSDKCDKLGIEYIVPCFSAIDFSKLRGISGHKSRYNIEEKEVQVCSQPFYRINIMQNGCVTLCTMLGLHHAGMNIHNITLKEIWNGEIRRRLLIKNLQGCQDAEMGKCRGCNVRFDFAYSEDSLDLYKDEILKRI